MGVQGGVTDLIKSVTHQVLVGQPRHMAGRPPSLASTDFKLWIPCYHLLDCVPMKQTHEMLQSGAAGQGVWSAGHSLGPLVNAFAHSLLVSGAFPW
jgi:hypothetical protein